MKISSFVPILLLASLLVAASAEERVSGPTLGFLLDGRVAVRPILGLLGAARLGAGRPLPEGLRVAALASGRPFALAVAADGALLEVDLSVDPPQPRPIPSAVSGADRLFFSPEGKAALAYHREERRAELLREVSGTFETAGTVELAPLPGVLTAVAVNDEGSAVLVGVASREGGGALYAIRPGAAPRLVLALQRALAVQFVNERDAVVADADRLEVLLIRDVFGAASSQLLLSSADGLTAPSAVAASPDAAFAYVAAPEAAAVFIAPLAGGAVRRIGCDCSPQSLERLEGGAFRLTDDPLQTIYLLDAATSEAEPRILFAPPASPSPAL